MDLTAESPGQEHLIPFDVAYEVVSEGHKYDRPIVHLFCRNAEAEPRHVVVDGFRPAFYVAEDTFVEHTTDVLNDRRVIGVEADVQSMCDRSDAPFGDDADSQRITERLTESHSGRVIDVGDDAFEALGTAIAPTQRLVKVFTKTPTDVGGGRGSRGLRGDIEQNWDVKTWEADVPFTRRFMISTGIHRGLTVPDDIDDDGKIHVRYENWHGSSSGTPVREIEPEEAPHYSPDAARQYSGIEYGVDVRPRMLTVDIEVATHGGGVPDPVRARNEVTAITAHDSYADEYRGWFLRHDAWDEDLDEDTFEAETDEAIGIETAVEVFEDETDMLDDFNQWVADRRFDLITGWNSSKFDYPYLIQRSYEVNAWEITEWDQLGNPGVWSDDDYGDRDVNFKIDGMVLWDMLDGYKKTLFRDVSSYRLEDVAQAELGYGKAPIEDIDEAWAHDPVDFVVYNTRDVEAVVEIERESDLMALYEHMRNVTGADLVDCHTNGPMIDTLFLRKAFEDGIGLPTNVEPEVQDYHGAYVETPSAGIWDNVIYPDLSSLYPMTMWTLNISPDTLIGNPEELEQSEYDRNDVFVAYVDTREFTTIPKGRNISKSDIDTDKYKGVLDENGSLRTPPGLFEPRYDEVYYLKPDVQEGFVRGTIDDLIDLKNEYRGSDSRYSAVKRVTNSCLTPDTEVLTPDGVDGITDIDIGDEVYSLDPETHELEIKQVEEIIERPAYDEVLVNIDTSRISFSVTPDHDMLVRRPRYSDGWEITEAGNLNDSSRYQLPHEWVYEHGDGIDTVSLIDLHPNPASTEVRVHPDVHGHTFVSQCPVDDERMHRDTNSGSYIMDGDVYLGVRDEILDLVDNVEIHGGSNEKWVPMMHAGDVFVDFLGWFIAEGSTYTSQEKDYGYTVRGGSSTVTISQQGDSQDEVQNILDRCGFDYYQDDKGFTTTSSVLVEILEYHCGESSGSMKIPKFIWDECSSDQKERLLEAMMHGDGDRRSGNRYTTKSKRLRDDVLRLTLELGYNTRYRYDDSSRYGDTVWRVRFDDGVNTFQMDRSGSSSMAEDGVYCVQVEDNHMLVAGRNGNFQHIPNCYGVLGDSASMGRGFRLFDPRLAESITLAGRKIIQYTGEEYVRIVDDLAEGSGYEANARLVGGDTDSVMTSVPGVPDFETAVEWAELASEEFLGTSDDPGLYDTFMEDEFDVEIGSDEHRMEVEVESLASKIFFKEDPDKDPGIGVKKRYVEHEVWNDTHGWIDTPDLDAYSNAPGDPDDRSEIKHLDSVTIDDYEDGLLSDQNPEDNLSITGFEYVRSDIAPITADVQERVFTDLLLREDYEDHIYSYLETVVEDVESENIPLSDIGRTKGVSQDLDMYGWKTYDELVADENYNATPMDERNGGRYVSTPSPTIRGLKYAIDHFPWQDDATKPVRIYLDNVRADGEYPEVYEYTEFPRDDRPDPPEVGRPVDAVAVDEPDRLPEQFVPDYEKMLGKEVRDPVQPILRTVGMDWRSVVGEGRQSGLDDFV